MQNIDPLLDPIVKKAARGLPQPSSASPTAAGLSKTLGNEQSKRLSGDNEAGAGAGSARPEGPDRVDAINQLFAEFELAYHNQYYKAYGGEDRLILAKKYWLSVLSDFSPQLIVAAGRRLVRSQEFLPTVSALIRTCEEGAGLFGLPAPRDAYLEACRAPAPKAAHGWSHPAVYLAGKAADWYLLASETEDRAFPIFAHYYRELCQRVMRGEELEPEVAPALVNNPGVALSQEEQQKRMIRLRQELGI